MYTNGLNPEYNRDVGYETSYYPIKRFQQQQQQQQQQQLMTGSGHCSARRSHERYKCDAAAAVASARGGDGRLIPSRAD